jgi:hypothetical protein
MAELFGGYCIDTSALIDLWRRAYPRDIFASLWKNIESLISQGRLIAPREVYRELAKQDDHLFKWAKAHKQMFKNLDSEQANLVAEIEDKFQDFVDENKDTPEGDPFVVALGMSKDFAVVSSETPANPGARPKIPDVCKAYNIKHFALLAFFRKENWTF